VVGVDRVPPGLSMMDETDTSSGCRRGSRGAGPGDPRRAPLRSRSVGLTKPKTVEGTGIMTWQFRKSKSSGPFRFTASKRDVSTSIGWGARG
jgi:hypothetical protein